MVFRRRREGMRAEWAGIALKRWPACTDRLPRRWQSVAGGLARFARFPRPPGALISAVQTPHLEVTPAPMDLRSLFHPAVAAWFERRFAAPTRRRRDAWPPIQAGRHTLIAAPTGSGKTLAAFLAAIDDLVREGIAGELPDETQVVYVSPLKALSQRHPARTSRRRSPASATSCARRACPTSRSARGAHRRHAAARAAARCAAGRRTSSSPRPSRCTCCSARESGRAMLAHRAHGDRRRDPRGGAATSAAAISRCRWSGCDALCGGRLLRIGLSATQKPIEEVARFLVGARSTRGEPTAPSSTSATCAQRDLALEVPPIAARGGDVERGVGRRSTTASPSWSRSTARRSIFVNTRRMAERVARHLSRAARRGRTSPRTTAAWPRSSGSTPSSG